MYSVNVKESGEYSLSVPVACDKQGGKFHLEIDGKDITGAIEIPDTGGWDKLQIVKRKGIQLTQGNHQIKMIMDSAGVSKSTGDIDCLIFEKN